MKRQIMTAMLAATMCLGFCGCEDDSSSRSESSVVTQKGTEAKDKTTTKAKTTTKKTVYISESKAISYAKDYIKKKYKDNSPVVIGEAKISKKYDDHVSVSVKGHYWEKDSYGHTKGSRDFFESVNVYDYNIR